MLRRVDVGRPQIGHQKVSAAEHIERQEAVAVVITVEEATLLMAMHRIVGRVDVQHDLFRRPRKGGDEALHQNLVNRPRPAPLGPVLETAQGRSAGQRTVAPGSGLKAQVMAQTGVVVQVLVAQRNPEHPLAQHVQHRMTQLAPLTCIAQPARPRRPPRAGQALSAQDGAGDRRRGPAGRLPGTTLFAQHETARCLLGRRADYVLGDRGQSGNHPRRSQGDRLERCALSHETVATVHVIVYYIGKQQTEGGQSMSGMSLIPNSIVAERQTIHTAPPPPPRAAGRVFTQSGIHCSQCCLPPCR